MASFSQSTSAMENETTVTGDTANLELLLNSACWEVGTLIAPSCEPCDDYATSDDSEGV